MFIEKSYTHTCRTRHYYTQKPKKKKHTHGSKPSKTAKTRLFSFELFCSTSTIENFFTSVLQTSIREQYATFCYIPNWIGRISNVSKYSIRNHSEENIQALWNELPNRLNIFDIFDEVNINEKFNILTSMIEKP